MLQPNRATREKHIRRLYEILHGEVEAMAPLGIWRWEDLGERVDFADRRLQREANRYEDGIAPKEDVLAAAEALRAAWRGAVEAFSAAAPQRAA